MSKEKSYHYFLVCGSLMCANAEEQISTITLNGILKNEAKDINVRGLANAQHVLQAVFHERMKGEHINVVDVVIINITYLGFMTKAKFEKMPDGVELPAPTAPAEDPNNNPFAQPDVSALLPTMDTSPA